MGQGLVSTCEGVGNVDESQSFNIQPAAGAERFAGNRGVAGGRGGAGPSSNPNWGPDDDDDGCGGAGGAGPARSASQVRRDEMRQSREEMRQARKETVDRAREWQRQIRSEQRQLDRDINRVRQEETKLKKEIKTMASKGEMKTVQTLAQSVVASRRSVARLEKTKCSLNALNLQLTTSIASASAASAMKLSADMMKEMNRMADVPQMQQTIQEMRTEMARAEVADEVMEEFYDEEDDAVEVDEEVQKVYEELALDTSLLLAPAPAVALGPDEMLFQNAARQGGPNVPVLNQPQQLAA